MMTRLNQLIDRLRGRRDEPNDEGVALLSALLFMVLVAGLSVLLLGVILSQAMPTYVAQKSTRTVYAAQAGLQAGLGLIRSATTTVAGKQVGVVSQLRCSLSGSVDAQDAATKYSVTISYFTQDPTGKADSWLAANKIPCSAGMTVPSYALLTSSGQGAGIPGNADTTAGDRKVSAIYKLKVTNVNIPGGLIMDFNKGYCLKASSATAGSKMTFGPISGCTTTDPLAQWVYDTDWKIKLASTLTTTPLCITGPATAGGGAQDALLQPCKSTADPLRWNQLWSWMGSHTWQGQNVDIASGPSGYYLSPGAATGSNINGNTLKVSGVSGGFGPSPTVGAGAANVLTNQIVNYKEFGRCADVTGEVITNTYMISYPCKQDPTGTGTYLKWNHKWHYTEPVFPATTAAAQDIWVYYLDNPASKYCLTTPTSGNYVTFKLCNSLLATQDWVRVLDTGVYANSYLFKDNQGRCLAVNPADLLDNAWSKIIVTACDGSLGQKWNAPAIYNDSTVGGYKEVN